VLIARRGTGSRRDPLDLPTSRPRLRMHVRKGAMRPPIAPLLGAPLLLVQSVAQRLEQGWAGGRGALM
jgi:hypothetical protein